MSTPLHGDVEQQGDLQLTSPAFDDGEQVLDDPDAQPFAGHTWDHWLAWDIDPDIGTMPEEWDAARAVEGFNDYVEQGYGGPSPPEGSHDYRFKLLALDSELENRDGG